MIPRRHAWLTRDVDSLYDADLPPTGLRRCRLCSVTERGHVLIARGYQEAHLAEHRLEKIIRDDRPALSGAAKEDA